jgi:sec-independent protein translocase protein TatA
MFAGGIGVQEIVIILIVGLLVFGAARLPKIARSLGQGIKEFKKTVKGLEDDDDEAPNKVRYVQSPPPNYQGQYQQGPQYQQPPQYQQGPQYQQPPQQSQPQQQPPQQAQQQQPPQQAQQQGQNPAQEQQDSSGDRKA